MVAWCLARYDASRRVLTTSQRLVGSNTLLASYTTPAALDRAIAAFRVELRQNNFAPDLPSGTYKGAALPGDTEPVPSQVVVTTAVQGPGAVAGGGTYAYGAQVTLTATPTDASAAPFQRWSDGVTQNPRSFTATGDATYTAIFAAPSQGEGGGMIGG